MPKLSKELYQRRFEKQPITVVANMGTVNILYQRRFEKQPITYGSRCCGRFNYIKDDLRSNL